MFNMIFANQEIKLQNGRFDIVKISQLFYQNKETASETDD